MEFYTNNNLAGTVIATGESAYSDTLNLKQGGIFRSSGVNGSLSLHLKTSGASSVIKVEIFAGNVNDTTSFVTPEGAADVVTAHEVGTNLYVIDTKMVANYMRLKFTASTADATINIASIVYA